MSGEHNSQNRTRKGWMFLVGMVVFGVLLAACVSTSKAKTYTIGVIVEVQWLSPIFDNFKPALAELGYVEGKNITYIYHSEAGPDLPAFEREAQSLRNQKVDLILTIGTLPTQAAKKAVEGTAIPVLFVPVINPVGEGIVANISHPGGNVTGVQVVDRSPKALEWFLKAVPGAKKVYVPYNPADTVTTPSINSLREVAPVLGIEFLPGEVSSADQMLAAIRSLPQGTVIFLTAPMPSLEPGVEAAGKLALERRIPIGVYGRLITDPPFPVTNYSVDVSAEAKQGAKMADQILKGGKPANIPVETAEYFLTINLKKAQELGIQIPDAILEQASTIVR